MWRLYAMTQSKACSKSNFLTVVAINIMMFPTRWPRPLNKQRRRAFFSHKALKGTFDTAGYKDGQRPFGRPSELLGNSLLLVGHLPTKERGDGLWWECDAKSINNPYSQTKKLCLLDPLVTHNDICLAKLLSSELVKVLRVEASCVLQDGFDCYIISRRRGHKYTVRLPRLVRFPLPHTQHSAAGVDALARSKPRHRSGRRILGGIGSLPLRVNRLTNAP